MDADYSFYVKSIATYAPTFLGYNNSVLAIVFCIGPNITAIFRQVLNRSKKSNLF